MMGRVPGRRWDGHGGWPPRWFRVWFLFATASAVLMAAGLGWLLHAVVSYLERH